MSFFCPSRQERKVTTDAKVQNSMKYDTLVSEKKMKGQGGRKGLFLLSDERDEVKEKVPTNQTTSQNFKFH